MAFGEKAARVARLPVGWVTGWESADVPTGRDFGGLTFFCFAFGLTLAIWAEGSIEILVLCLDPDS